MPSYALRAGDKGQHEQEFFNNDHIFTNWGEVDCDLSECTSKRDIFAILQSHDPSAKPASHNNGAGYLYHFVRGMRRGDLVLISVKRKPVLHVAEVTGAYQYVQDAPRGQRHRRAVRWVMRDLPRERLDQLALRDIDRQGSILELSIDTDQHVRDLLANYGAASTRTGS